MTQHILSQIHEQIARTDTKNISVIIIDDGSTDGTLDMIKNQFADVHLIEGNGSLWWTGAICLGMKYAIEKLESDYIVWLNDDISLAEDFIIKLCDICESGELSNEIIGGIIRDQTYKDWIVFSGMVNKKLIRSMDDFGTAAAIKVDTLNGNLAIIPRGVVDKIGLPDLNRFRHYGGDFEFIFRAKNAGCKVILSSSIQATTDYQVSDLIRYMPPWMQWHLAHNLAQRKEILQGFTNLKSHYNIWHMVNINHCGVSHVPLWKYSVFYIRQVLKVIASDFWSIQKKEMDIRDYLKLQNVPQEIEEYINSQIINRGK
ncbi:glycosyltransferase family 2 protein [Symplocastrum sp. BBK-W-15]|uniref:Glycosyltransferase family 2 protein n=1 Tax=Limnofasciculus baicalensis BBK-W-15 TaxID=2699891 RepID=A0AAE3KN71_9CYAN|nr:glycosyltransferase family 2 protein [Limnofasciculus baicalensis BBK-W-15]